MTREENETRNAEREALKELVGLSGGKRVKNLEVKYVAMPISIEEKKAYHAQGFRVIDIRFKPADLEEVEPVEKETPVRRRRRNVETDEE